MEILSFDAMGDRMNNSILLLCILSLATLNVGCQPTETADRATAVPSSSGYFEGEVVASWDSDGRKMTLREDFSYVDPNNRRWLAPAGSVVDGASIPPAFWTFVGGPFEGQYRKASVVHDVGCVERTASWEDVHRMFYDACVAGGLDEQRAKVLYYAVYHFGPRWEPVIETVVETHENEQGQLVQERVQRRTMHCSCPAPPTSDEIQQVVDMVVDDNPNPTELEHTTREELHRRPRHRRNGDRYRQKSSENFASGRNRDSENQYSNRRPSGRRETGQFASTESPRYNQQSDEFKQRDGRRSRREQPVVPEDEKQWVAKQVQSHLVNRLRQPEPDTYNIERAKDGYRVTVGYHERDQQGQPVVNSNSNFYLTAKVSAAGEVLEILR